MISLGAICKIDMLCARTMVWVWVWCGVVFGGFGGYFWFVRGFGFVRCGVG